MTSVDRIQGLSGQQAIKTPCRLATTAAITLSGEQTIDGVAAVEGDRVLVKDQADTTTNGVYDVSTGSWTRSIDFDGANDIVDGTMVLVGSGSTNADLVFKLNATEPITIDTTALTFTVATTFTDISAFGATLLDDANAAAARATLGLAIGTNVQAYDAQLDTWSGVTPGTGVATALAIDVGSAGAPVVNGGALGTPSSGTLTNCTGYPAAQQKIVQVVEATPITAKVTCTTNIPFDATIPQNTAGAEEGDEVITCTITPTSATNRLRIEFEALGHAATAGYVIAALFQDSTANALAVDCHYDADGVLSRLAIIHEMAAGTTSATTFKIRGGGSATTVYFNGLAASVPFGGIAASRLRVTEIKV